jgi:sugar lactone lactonase YvrE
MRKLTVEPDQLGDGPIWDGVANRLYWLDIVGKRISSCREDGSSLERRSFRETPGSHAARENGGRLVAFRRRIVLFDAQGNEEASVDAKCVDWERERFNDGACDSEGRFWVGTMDRHLRDRVGALYCVRPDHSIERMADGLGISNGIAWNPSFDRMYVCDSLFPRILVYSYDIGEGLIRDGRLFAEFSSDMGVPDGCAMDANGCLWVATPGVNRVVCFSPDGRVRDFIEVPTAWPSSLAFGGAALQTMFITSLQPHAGSTSPRSRAPSSDSAPDSRQTSHGSCDGIVYAAEAPVRGLEEPRYRG